LLPEEIDAEDIGSSGAVVRSAVNKLVVLAVGVIVLIAAIEGVVEVVYRPTFW
jgi:hypothetical protein